MPTQQISGTIYQMYDASGNYRRFPVTVVDAVLGLASYLQEQFSSLANLYMGINDVALSGTVLTVKGVQVNLATVTDLSNYYTKTEADGRFLGINANAASATKLQTARTIWGQSFDGTANVTGAMSGVTSIDSLINIESGYVGIGKTPSVALDVNGQISGTQLVSTVTSSAPLVVSSSALVSNLNADKLDNYDLSDILAMDITGNAKTATNPKSELKTGQEFVFRKANVEWDAKSGVIKKILGKSLAWNQLATNVADAETYANIVVTNDGNGTSTYNGTANTQFQRRVVANMTAGDGHKILVKGLSGGTSGYYTQILYNNYDYILLNNITTKDVMFTWDASKVNFSIYFLVSNGTQVTNVKITPQVTDLTLLYGSALDGKTDAEILAMYEADFGTGYYPYDDGTLKSNDAEAVETTGKNMWDKTQRVSGYYVNYQDGSFVSSGDYTHTGFVPIIGGNDYYYEMGVAYGDWGAYYDANKNFIIGDADFGNPSSRVKTAPSNARYVVVSVNKSASSDNIIINLHNSAFDGQYEPYKKVVLPLNLGNIKVVSPNVWDEEWESGIYDPADGQPSDDTSRIRSKNYIPITPEVTYYKSNNAAWVLFYDSNKNYINEYVNTSTFKAPLNSRFCKFYSVANYGSTYNHDIAINISNPAFNGRYFPYGTLELEGGVKGNGEWADYVDVVNQKYYKRAERICVGDYISSSYGTGSTYFSPSPARNSSGSHSYNIACNRGFTTEKSWAVMTDNIPNVNANDGNLYYVVTDNSLVVSEYIDYELQYEEVYDLAEPLPSVYPCDQFGTERVISPVSVTPSAPFCADIQYGAKSDDVANDLIGTRDAVQPLLDALQYDGQNHAWHLKGNLYADGFITAYGTNESEALQALKDWVTENFEPKQS